MSSPMKNKHVCLYFLDGCFSSLNSASVSEFPLRFLVTESVGDSSHPFFKKKTIKWFAVVYHNFFLYFYLPFYFKLTELSFN